MWQDQAPGKRIDFLSVHYYIDNGNGLRRSGMIWSADEQVRRWLGAAYHVRDRMEGGGREEYEGRPQDALRWATGTLTHTYRVAEQNVLPMHWVYPREEDRHCMVAPVGAPLVFFEGNAIKLVNMLRSQSRQEFHAIDGSGTASTASPPATLRASPSSSGIDMPWANRRKP